MIYLHIYQRIKNAKQFSKQILLKNLEHYTHKKSRDIVIHRNSNGKPSTEGMDFSISHCQDVVVQAFVKNSEIGIDIEIHNPKRNYMALVERYFHPSEFDYLKNLGPAKAVRNFYNLWTAKEAICKAQGGRLWYYLGDNYLTINNTMITQIKGLNLQYIDAIDHYGFSVASSKKAQPIKVIHA